MMCPRCIKAVREVIESFGLSIINIELGEVILDVSMEEIDFVRLKEELDKEGFELLADKKRQIINKIKLAVAGYIKELQQTDTHVDYSEYISLKVEKDYHYLSTLFSGMEQITIEKYIILKKVERVKELIIYDELNLSEISFKLQYSSVAHLSRQFKQVTGLTPTQFKTLRKNREFDL
jgi:AraC-like DNA-binding protein